MEMYNCVVRSDLKDMICWYIGINTGFSVSAGKLGKYFKKFLPRELYAMYAKTYTDSNYENFWEAIFIACELFRNIASAVADYLGYTYNWQDDENIATYLKRVKNNDYAAK
jgi:aminoglycoside 6-adenylyltransferase